MRCSASALALAAAVALLAAPVAFPSRSGAAGPPIRRDVTYRVAGDERLRLDAYLARGGPARPAIVFVHGGGFRAGDKTFVAPGQQPVAPLAAELVRRGFAVFSVDYRLAPRFRFPAAAEDVRAAVRWIRRQARWLGVDPQRIALFGASAGGNLAALAAVSGRGPLDRGARVRAAVSWSGPMDLARFYRGHAFVSEYLGCVPAACPGRYRAASPVGHVDRRDPPLLLVNGSTELVPLAQAREMASRLTSAQVPHRLVVVPGSRHAGDYELDVWRATVRFLARHLGR